MKKIKKILEFILKAIGLIALFILLLSAFSDRISPQTCVWFAYLGLFFPFILGFNILIFILYLFFKQWKQVAIFFVGFLICFSSIHTYFPFHTKTKTIPENCIKILTYNVMRFDNRQPHTKEHPNPIVQYMADCDADIICIQEFGASKENKSLLLKADILNALKKTPYYYIYELKYPFAGELSGLALFSKYPILKTENISYNSEYNGSFVAELDINGRKVTLVNNHLESNKLSPDERIGYYDMTKDPNTEKLEFFTQMMHKRLTPAFKTRAFQAQQIAKIIKENKNPYIIVCGDFNDTPISYSRHKIKGDLNDAFVSSGRGMGITFNKYRFLFRIDYILHSKNIKAYNCTVGKLKNSDHYPVYTYLEFLD